MKKRFRLLFFLTLFLFIVAIAIFPLSVTLGKTAADPDAFEMMGLLFAFGGLLIAILSALITGYTWDLLKKADREEGVKGRSLNHK